MKEASAASASDGSAAPHLFHRVGSTRAARGGPLAPAGNDHETTSVLRAGWRDQRTPDQWDISTGTVIDFSIVRVTPPQTSSAKRDRL